MLKSIWTLTFIGCTLVACKEKESKRDVNYYTKHVSERKKKIAQCKNNPGELENTSNCRNAMEAEGQHILNFPNSNQQSENDNFDKFQEEFKKKLKSKH